MSDTFSLQPFVSNIATVPSIDGPGLKIDAQLFIQDDGTVTQLVIINEEAVRIEDAPALVNAILAARDAVVVMN
ncbi:hypothetical protein FXW78_55050 [Rhodococcus opacus]|nr:hypothetical protein [Rhodococcus opacus]